MSEKDITRASEAAIRWLLDQIDEANFHVCGNNWQRLGDLIDYPGGVFGDIVAWSCLAGIKANHPSLNDCGDALLDPKDINQEFARKACLQVLGVSDWFFCEQLENKPVNKVKETLSVLLESRKEKSFYKKLHKVETDDAR